MSGGLGQHEVAKIKSDLSIIRRKQRESDRAQREIKAAHDRIESLISHAPLNTNPQNERTPHDGVSG